MAPPIGSFLFGIFSANIERCYGQAFQACSICAWTARSPAIYQWQDTFPPVCVSDFFACIKDEDCKKSMQYLVGRMDTFIHILPYYIFITTRFKQCFSKIQISEYLIVKSINRCIICSQLF